MYGITYTGIEGSAPDVTLPTTHTYGTATENPTLTRTGYVFNGWVVNGEGAAQTNLTLGAEDYTGAVTLTAAWTAERYAIIYELDGGVNAAGNPAQYTVDQTITLEDPTKPGYTFKGWYADKDFTTLTVGIPVGSTEAKTFYAKREQNPYKITWNVNEGDELTGEGYTVEAFYGNPITAPSDPARRGYTFGGWYTDGSNYAENTKIKTGDKLPEGDVTYYAKWTAIQYTITYNLDGGTNVSGNPAQYTVETGKITLVAPTKTGYRFDGWYSDAERTNRVTEIAADSTGAVTLYAKWTIKQYTVTWETNGGNDQTGALHTDERNEGTDAHHDGELEVERNGVHDELADARHREQEEDEAGNEHRTKTRLPGEAGGTADIVGEERRNAETGGHAHGVSGPQAHQQGHRDRDENHAARGRIAGNAAVGEHGGNDEYEIAHRHEGGDAGRDFLRNRSAVLLEAEETFND